MDIVKYIVEILIEKDQVVIPGLGSFITEYNSAKIHPVDSTFVPPVKSIIFDEITPDDDMLARRISEKENISLTVADKEIKNFSDSILADIQKNKRAIIEGLGTFSINFENIITFTPAEINFSDESFGLTEFQSPAVVRNEYKEMAEVKVAEEKKKEIDRKKKNQTYLIIAGIVLILIVFIIIYIFTNTSAPYEKKNRPIATIDTSKPKPQPIVDTTHLINDSANTTEQASETNTAVENNTPVEVKKTEPDKKIKVKDKPATDIKYYIIAGSFKIEVNANSRVAELKAKGFANAGVIKHIKNDLFVAYYDVFSNKDKASKEHKRINADVDKDAWIMKK